MFVFVFSPPEAAILQKMQLAKAAALPSAVSSTLEDIAGLEDAISFRQNGTNKYLDRRE